MLDRLRQRGLVEDAPGGRIALTAAGRRGRYERLVEATCAERRELVGGWTPDRDPEVRRLIDRLGRDLVGEVGEPPASGQPPGGDGRASPPP